MKIENLKCGAGGGGAGQWKSQVISSTETRSGASQHLRYYLKVA